MHHPGDRSFRDWYHSAGGGGNPGSLHPDWQSIPAKRKQPDSLPLFSTSKLEINSDSISTVSESQTKRSKTHKTHSLLSSVPLPRKGILPQIHERAVRRSSTALTHSPSSIQELVPGWHSIVRDPPAQHGSIGVRCPASASSQFLYHSSSPNSMKITHEGQVPPFCHLPRDPLVTSGAGTHPPGNTLYHDHNSTVPELPGSWTQREDPKQHFRQIGDVDKAHLCLVNNTSGSILEERSCQVKHPIQSTVYNQFLNSEFDQQFFTHSCPSSPGPAISSPGEIPNISLRSSLNQDDASPRPINRRNSLLPSVDALTSSANKQNEDITWQQVDTNLPDSDPEDQYDLERNETSSNLGIEDICKVKGRLSNDKEALILEGFRSLDSQLKQISMETGIPASQITQLWETLYENPQQGPWNIYQQYIQDNKHRDNELERLGQAVTFDAPGVVEKAYARFKMEVPKYKDVLRTWNLSKLLFRAPAEGSKRKAEFKRYCKTLSNLTSQASAHGFEIRWVCVDAVKAVKIKGQDRCLGLTGGNEATKNFFPDRLGKSDAEIIEHLQAHTDNVPSQDKCQTMPSTDTNLEPPLPCVKAGGNNQENSVKGKVLLNNIKQRLVAAAKCAGLDIYQNDKLLWEILIQKCAQHGIIINNWPEEVSFPGKTVTAQARGRMNGGEVARAHRGKGISALKRNERLALFDALGREKDSLRFEKISDKSIPTNEPIIIGVPPARDSPYKFGRRKFSDMTVDRKGPPRLSLNITNTIAGRN